MSGEKNALSISSLKNHDLTKYLTFSSNGNSYAVSAFDVLQIIKMTHITPIPESLDYIRGILHLRGRNIPVIDLGLRLLEKPVEKSSSARIVVLSTTSGNLGLIVESIGEIINLSTEDISPVPRMTLTPGKNTLTAIATHEGHLIPILDTPALLSDKEISNINQNEEEPEKERL